MDDVRMNFAILSSALTLLLFCTEAAEGFQCYSCSYTISGDPSVDYECVNAPRNVSHGSTTMPCSGANQCITKAVYSTGYRQIRSVLRTCQVPSLCQTGSCCDNYGPYPSCETVCRSDECNDDNPESRLKKDGPSGGALVARGDAFLVMAIGTSAFLMTLHRYNS